jgi:two-component system alkaline phosphatase synthesis response regulator PhoP
MLPGMDGLEVLAQLRRESNVYVILLTAKTEELDRVLGLTVGADDYVTKPFSPRELTARVKAALRRLQSTPAAPAGAGLVFQRMRIDAAGRQAWVDENLLDLTAIEFDLLRTLAEHRGLVLSREQLLEKVWETTYFSDLRVVDVHIGHLRQKLGDAGALIATVRGAGYRFDDEKV